MSEADTALSAKAQSALELLAVRCKLTDEFANLRICDCCGCIVLRKDAKPAINIFPYGGNVDYWEPYNWQMGLVVGINLSVDGIKEKLKTHPVRYRENLTKKSFVLEDKDVGFVSFYWWPWNEAER